jgi:flagellar assembly protein FliH
MSISTVINDVNKERYTISNYHLKVLQCDLPDLKEVESGIVQGGFKTFDDIENGESQESAQEITESAEDKEAFPIENGSEPVANESHDELIESLLKKADDFSSKYLKSQMDLETLQEESEQRIAQAREEAFKEGQEAAIQEQNSESERLQNDVVTQLQHSIETLSSESQQFTQALHSVKEELVSAALAIAKEVIVKEVSANSNEVALSLASSLMKEIDAKSEIILKVHVNQLDMFTAAMSTNEHIKVVVDKAVSDGGVILVGQMGTIEADIMQRFEHIKRNALP